MNPEQKETRISHTLRRLCPSVGWPVTICVLFYGDFPELARRFFRSLHTHTPSGLYELRIGLNAVGETTKRLAGEAARHIPGTRIFESRENLFKCPMMRRLFFHPPITSRWAIWFDDDSYVTRGDWLAGLALHLEQFPEAAIFGKPLFVKPGPDTLRFVQNASWYRGLPWLTRPHPSRGGVQPIFKFVAGGFWAFRTEALRGLDWPDPRLIHNEEDYLLGEALRQNGFSMRPYTGGVAINRAARRGPSEPIHRSVLADAKPQIRA